MKDITLNEWREKLIKSYQDSAPKGQVEPKDDWVYLIHEAELHRAYGRIMETIELMSLEKEDVLKKSVSRIFWAMGGDEKSVIHQDTLNEVAKVVPMPTFLSSNS